MHYNKKATNNGTEWEGLASVLISRNNDGLLRSCQHRHMTANKQSVAQIASVHVS